MELITIVLMALGYVAGLAGMWLRSRMLAQPERIRGRCMVELAQTLPGGGQVCEGRADGSSLSLLTPAREDGGNGWRDG